MNKLSNQVLHVSVPGKTILIGEHAVVYGHCALAMPLHDVRLTLSILPEEQTSWNDAWKIQMQGKVLELNTHFKTLLTSSLALALKLFGYDLSAFTPQTLFIDSQIPLGGGMGGSAAVSASLIKLCSKIFSHPLSLEEEIEFANQIDSIFHSGRASGLDVAAILSGQLIQFQKGIPFKPIQHQCSFFAALIDSGERAETGRMIQKVSNALEAKDRNVENALQDLGQLAIECEKHLNEGNLEKFAHNLNQAQKSLEKLGVSTQTLNKLCEELIQQGALCAKLTGAGGGGLVLAIFDKNPDFLQNRYVNKVYITMQNA